MSSISQIEDWGNSHRLAVMDYFRIALGGFLTFKGVQFLSDLGAFQEITGGLDIMFASAGLAHYVIFVHILGGPLIALGLFTRGVCLLQIPVLIGAVFLVNFPKGFLSMGNHMELEMSIISLVLLVVFVIFGAGKLSIDEIRRKELASKKE